MVSPFNRVWINRVLVVNPVRGHFRGENMFALSPFVPENLVSLGRCRESAGTGLVPPKAV